MEPCSFLSARVALCFHVQLMGHEGSRPLRKMTCKVRQHAFPLEPCGVAAKSCSSHLQSKKCVVDRQHDSSNATVHQIGHRMLRWSATGGCRHWYCRRESARQREGPSDPRALEISAVTGEATREPRLPTTASCGLMKERTRARRLWSMELAAATRRTPRSCCWPSAFWPLASSSK